MVERSGVHEGAPLVVKPLFGETVRVGKPVPSLAEYYRGGLRVQADPGTSCPLSMTHAAVPVLHRPLADRGEPTLEMRKPVTSEDDVCWGGRRWKFSSDAQKVWLERMAAKGWTRS